MIAKHFEELGYKNFGFISGPKRPIKGIFKQPPIDAIFRRNGFLDHISENPSLQLVWTFDGDFSSSTGRVAFEDFSKTRRSCCQNEMMQLQNTCVFCFDDLASFCEKLMKFCRDFTEICG